MILNDISSMLEITDSYQAPEKIMKILFGDVVERNRVFNLFLDYFKCDMSRNWFHEYFEDEHADRKNQKQDFTPDCLSKVVSELLGSSHGVSYEPAAGTGGMVVTNWYRQRSKTNLFDYKPNENLVACGELSDKTLPFLLFNLSIRGISGVVFHGDTLRKIYKGIYILVNEYNNPTDFSKVTYNSNI